jgi:hypothetical protein
MVRVHTVASIWLATHLNGAWINTKSDRPKAADLRCGGGQMPLASVSCAEAPGTMSQTAVVAPPADVAGRSPSARPAVSELCLPV